jgi:hypothetical protein
MPRKEKRSRTAPDLKSTSPINSDTRHLRLYRFKELHPRGSRLEQQAFRAECTLRVWQDCHLLRLDRRDLLSPNRKDWKPAKGLLQKRQYASIDRHSPQFNYKQPDAKNAEGDSEPPRRRIPPRGKVSKSNCAAPRKSDPIDRYELRIGVGLGRHA